MATGWCSMFASLVLIWYYKNAWSGVSNHYINNYFPPANKTHNLNAT